MLKEFKAFIMKGNVLELAVAVIIAGAFGAIVKSLTADVIMPPIGLALGGVDFSSLAIVLQEGVSNDAGELVQEEVAIRYGIFIQRILDFVIIAFIVFMIIRSYNRLTEKKEAEEAPPAPKGPSQEELLAEIRDLLKK
ncbi:MAG: large-conductance mechanosensitive channel protein MscL [Phaeodactylibacter sp.]|jgi:large conductance mechanosensitive channel|uniref:large-conductance mechanosensitive channel protein MscL n=1 Tax=Phaeodactylibacter TaxID=1564515 RepID=UPI0024A8133A|nr:large-conductance mechanosensitive channel protein MscL [Phaeodactylibacter xiamenensis]